MIFRSFILLSFLNLAFVLPTDQEEPEPESRGHVYNLIRKTADLPGIVDTAEIKRLSTPLKALAAFYSAMGGSGCTGETCELTSALGLGKQGSDEHKKLIQEYFPGDRVAETVLAQDCYQRPSGASSFSDFQFLSLFTSGDTVKVQYTLMNYDHGKTTWIKGPDIYLFQQNRFVKIKRNLWYWMEK